MENLQTFENERFGQLRTYRDENGNFWFAAVDVCGILGIHNTCSALNALDDDEKITIDNIYGNPRSGTPHQISLISEPGLYSLILRSRKPEAKIFKRWVTHEVIPAIRKTGQYRLPGSSSSKTADTKTAEELVNARLQVVTLRIMGSMSIYSPAMRMKFMAEAASLMSGKPMSEYLPPMEAGDVSNQWLPASGLAKRYGLSNSEIGRLLKKRGLHGSQDENHEWSLPICYPDQDGLCKLVGYLYNLEILEPRLRRATEDHHDNPCH